MKENKQNFQQYYAFFLNFKFQFPRNLQKAARVVHFFEKDKKFVKERIMKFSE